MNILSIFECCNILKNALLTGELWNYNKPQHRVAFKCFKIPFYFMILTQFNNKSYTRSDLHSPKKRNMRKIWKCQTHTQLSHSNNAPRKQERWRRCEPPRGASHHLYIYLENYQIHNIWFTAVVQLYTGLREQSNIFDVRVRLFHLER